MDALTAPAPHESKRPAARETPASVPHDVPAPAAHEAPAPSTAAEPRAAPVEAARPAAAAAQEHAAPRHAAPVRPIPELPPVALTLPAESGLELVETKFKPSPAAEPEVPAGPRRVRPPKVTVADEPLQMVETTHKDAPPPAG
jgi:hypothetical protein